MKYKIVADSCCDLFSKEYSTEKVSFSTAPLTITVGDVNFIDVESLDTKQLIAAMKVNKSAPKTACPSPESFMDEMEGYDNIFCVTLSSKLSGSYNSACLAAKSIKEKSPHKKILIIDSLSASAGMILIVNKLKELIESEQYTFEEISTKIIAFRNATRVRFVLHDMGNLIKAGRMSKVLGLVVSVLNIKPILGDDGEGEIKMCANVIGTKKAMMKLSEYPIDKARTNGPDTPIVITHCYNEEDALYLKDLLITKLGLTNIKVYLMRGLSSFYASAKGLILAY